MYKCIVDKNKETSSQFETFVILDLKHKKKGTSKNLLKIQLLNDACNFGVKKIWDVKLFLRIISFKIIIKFNAKKILVLLFENSII